MVDMYLQRGYSSKPCEKSRIIGDLSLSALIGRGILFDRSDRFAVPKNDWLGTRI